MSTQIALTKKQKNKINRALMALEEVRSEVSEYWEDERTGDITWYLEDTASLYLMDGDSHGNADNAYSHISRRDYSIDSFLFFHASGGGW